MMAWTEENAAEASKRGWKLCDVYDGKRWMIAPMPTGGFPKSTPHAAALMQFIVRAAQSGDDLSKHAIKHISQANR